MRGKFHGSPDDFNLEREGRKNKTKYFGVPGILSEKTCVLIEYWEGIKNGCGHY